MYTIGQVESQIKASEKFPVRIQHSASGRKVRSDRDGYMPYGFRTASWNRITIRTWIKKRFRFLYRDPNITCVILNPDGEEYGDLTRLSTVRRDWKED